MKFEASRIKKLHFLHILKLILHILKLANKESSDYYVLDKQADEEKKTRKSQNLWNFLDFLTSQRVCPRVR